MCDNPPTHGDQQITIVEEAHPSSRYATPFPHVATSHFYIITMMWGNDTPKEADIYQHLSCL